MRVRITCEPHDEVVEEHLQGIVDLWMLRLRPSRSAFGVFMLKPSLSGRGDEIVDLAKVNLFR